MRLSLLQRQFSSDALPSLSPLYRILIYLPVPTWNLQEPHPFSCHSLSLRFSIWGRRRFHKIDMLISHSLKRPHSEEISLGSAKRPEIKTAPDVSENICTRCNDIPWKQLANEVLKPSTENLMAKIAATYDELRLSPCSACQALALIKPASLDGKKCHLRSYSARKVLAEYPPGISRSKSRLRIAVFSPTGK